MRLPAGVLAATLALTLSTLGASAQERGGRQSSRSQKVETRGSRRQTRSVRPQRRRSRNRTRNRTRRREQRRSNALRRTENRLETVRRQQDQRQRQRLERTGTDRTRVERSARERGQAFTELTDRFRSAGLQGSSAERAAEQVSLGLPSEASADKPEDFLIAREEYVISYNRDRKVANWASWKLNSENFGATKRSGKFRTDPNIPESWKPARKADYKNSGYTRGHLVSSGSRTSDSTHNRATFFLSNIVPQTAEQNAGPWHEVELRARELAQDGKDVYMMAGPLFEGETGTIGDHQVAIPSALWKVAVVVDKGTPPDQIGANADVISVLMPNDASVKGNEGFQKYRVTPAEIEKRTGLHFFGNLPSEVRSALLQKGAN